MKHVNKARMLKDKPAIREQAQRVEGDLSAIRRALRKSLEPVIASGELTVPQTAVMRIVVAHQSISLRDLSREVSLAHSTVSGIADRLEKRGMIERRADPADGRICRIYPTQQVMEFVRDKFPALTSEPLVKALNRATGEERAEIERAVRRLRELLEQP
jgi:DNA-binding MarR family transcriptional regulator